MNCPKCGLINTGNTAVGLAMPQCMCHWQALAPPRQWVGLAKEDKWEIVQETERDDRGHVMALVEAKLKEKNT